MAIQVEQTALQNGLIRVNREILVSLRKSWLVPRGTGTLFDPHPPKQIIGANNYFQPKLDFKNFDVP